MRRGGRQLPSSNTRHGDAITNQGRQLDANAAMKQQLEQQQQRRQSCKLQMTPRRRMMFIVHSLLMGMPYSVMMSSRVEIYIRDSNGNTAIYGDVLAFFSTYSNVASLLTTPLFGGLCETIGRRPMVLFGLSGSLLIRSIEYAGGHTMRSLLLGNYIAPLFAGSYIARVAAIGDIYGDDVVERAIFDNQLGLTFTIVNIVGPPLGAWLASIDKKMPFVAAFAMSLANWFLVYFCFEETLPDEDRKPFAITTSNPLSFLSFFSKGKELLILTLMRVLNEVSQSVYTVLPLFRQDVLGWGLQKRSYFTSLASIVALPGYAFSGRLLKFLGQEWGYLIGMGSIVGSNLVRAQSTTDWEQAILLPVQWPYLMGSASLSSMFNRAALDAGMGHAEIQAAISNLISVVGILAPTLMNSTYQLGRRRGQPGLVFRLVAAAVVLEIALSRLLRRRRGRAGRRR